MFVAKRPASAASSTKKPKNDCLKQNPQNPTKPKKQVLEDKTEKKADKGSKKDKEKKEKEKNEKEKADAEKAAAKAKAEKYEGYKEAQRKAKAKAKTKMTATKRDEERAQALKIDSDQQAEEEKEEKGEVEEKSRRRWKKGIQRRHGPFNKVQAQLPQEIRTLRESKDISRADKTKLVNASVEKKGFSLCPWFLDKPCSFSLDWNLPKRCGQRAPSWFFMFFFKLSFLQLFLRIHLIWYDSFTIDFLSLF